MKKFSKILLVCTLFLSLSLLSYSNESKNLSSKEALQKLVEGNERFIKEDYSNQHIDKDYRKGLTKGQNPFAIVVTCSDSRVAPELLFDQGLGDIFIIRTAGEVVDKLELGSIEYAVEHLGVNLVVVLGHENCGAVGAVIKGGDIPKNISYIADEIKPAVDKAKTQEGDLEENAIKNNVDLIVDKIKKNSEIIEEAKDCKVIGGVYSITTGKVEFFNK
ncbi:MAG: carbonic anhydrase [Fusobacteriaceae bacterium]|nr:carbonic anhydrase [Fusobacteriaceae bacterium]MBN2837710.1 carbonic anhydrase [Fusobacteriaceae bacterium]